MSTKGRPCSARLHPNFWTWRKTDLLNLDVELVACNIDGPAPHHTQALSIARRERPCRLRKNGRGARSYLAGAAKNRSECRNADKLYFHSPPSYVRSYFFLHSV